MTKHRGFKRSVLLLIALFFGVIAVAYAERPSRARANKEGEVLTIDDVKAETVFGREVAAMILGKYPLYQNEEMTRYVNLVVRYLAQYSSRPELNFTVGILDTDMINGFSTPGGYIFITRGAIEAMEDEAELAGVLGHEMTHVTRRHIVKELNIHGSDASPAAGFSHVIGGGTDVVKVAFVQAMDQAMNILFERGLKKENEIEADTEGTLLIATAGYDPSALDRYFRKIKTGDDRETKSIKHLHPSFDERIGWVENTIRSNGLDGGAYKMNKERFDEICRKKK